MSKIKSVFGKYSEALQVMIDSSLSQFNVPWYKKYFTMGIPSTKLDFTTIIGRDRIEAAASVIARGSSAPLRVRATLDKLSGEVPVIAEKFSMKEADYRDWLSLQAMPVSDELKKQQILDLIFADVKKAANAPHKRLDLMVLEGLYTGAVSLDITNNPDGVVLNNAIDLMMPATNKTTVTIDWATAATATPIDDMRTVVNYHQARGVNFAKVLMSPALLLKVLKTKQVGDMLSAFAGVKGQTVFPTLTRLNEFLTEALLPVIEVVNETIGVEKDGVISTVRPFGDVNAVFIPAGNLGEIKNALSIEQLVPVKTVDYATFDGVLIKKWQSNDPFAEWTEGEFNAFPSFGTIDQVAILDTTP
jgi:hypothetical protein